jgi:preprotein translocase subunit YajC
MTESIQPTEQDQPGSADKPLRRARPEKQPAKQDRTTVVLLLVAAFVAVAGVSFALGHVTAPTAAAAGGNGRAGGFGARFSLAPGQTLNPGAFAGRGGLGSVTGGITGTVQSITSTSVTIQEASGSTVTINLDGTTTYHSAAAASASDVKVGSSVTVQIDTSALASQTPVPNASGALGGRTLTAKDILITNP